MITFHNLLLLRFSFARVVVVVVVVFSSVFSSPAFDQTTTTTTTTTQKAAFKRARARGVNKMFPFSHQLILKKRGSVFRVLVDRFVLFFSGRSFPPLY
jgi:hypothetical protein